MSLRQSVRRSTAGLLVERDRELLAADDALDRARSGSGSLLLFEGRLGSGKSTLLGAVARIAEQKGMGVLRAAGDEWEQDFPFGVVLQLFEPALSTAEPAYRESLLGAAGPAGSLLSPGGGSRTPSETAPPQLLHGMYRLASKLAEPRPLVLVVDDAHWIDAATARYLLYLARRLDELPVAVALCALPGAFANGPAPFGELAAHPSTERLELSALSEEATDQLVRTVLPHASDETTRSCWELTRGNPLLLQELLETLASDSAQSVRNGSRVPEVTPDATTERTLARIERLGPEAVALARSAAVLGDDARLRRAALLVGLDPDDASAAADRLVAADLLAEEGPLKFVSPLVRNCVLRGLLPAERSRLQLEAARLLAAERAPVERVAAHLLTAQERGSDWVVETLVEAADRSLARGAPSEAVGYLRRALSEPPGDRLRVSVQLMLGQAEAAVGEPAALSRMDGALELIEDSSARASVRLEIGGTLHAKGRHRDAADAFRQGLLETDVSDDLRVQLKCAHLTATRLSHGLEESEEESVAHLVERYGDPERAAGRQVLAHAAFEAALGGSATAAEAAALAQRSLGGGRLLEDEHSDGVAYYLASAALIFAEDLQGAEIALTLALEDARRRGSVLALATASYFHAFALLRRGRVTDAAADVQRALAGARQGWGLALPAAHGLLAEACLERGELEAAEREVDLPEAEESFEDHPFFPCYLAARGRVRLAAGREQAALDDLLECGRLLEARGVLGPAFVPWRSSAAIAARQLGEVEQARELAEEELSLASDFEAPGCFGRALRTVALVGEGDERIWLLERSAAELERSQLALERARTLIELGSALRRSRRRSAAREPLLVGADLARRCGAERLVARARQELVAAGSRPRRVALSGVASLTPRERQVVELAADGLGNREVAEALFVTVKTVEWHLRNAFDKLGVGSRDELSAALDPASKS